MTHTRLPGARPLAALATAIVLFVGAFAFATTQVAAANDGSRDGSSSGSYDHHDGSDDSYHHDRDGSDHSRHSRHHESSCSFEQMLALHDTMRQLWEEHVLWTRLFIVAQINNLSDLPATTTRLLDNQQDIADAIEPFFGQSAADQLHALLEQHILQAADILNDAEANDTVKLEQDKAAWYANADQIASFLHDANPDQWSLDALTQMMREHLDLTLAEATDELTGNYPESVSDFDQVENEILGMADTLSSGIIAEFCF